MQPPDVLLRKGITSLPTIGDGRQSGTADSPSILNASPESAVGGGLAWIRTGDAIRIDIASGTRDVLVSDVEIEARKRPGIPSDPAEHDAVAEDLPRDSRPVGGRCSNRGRRPIPRHLPHYAATQPLGRRVLVGWRTPTAPMWRWSRRLKPVGNPSPPPTGLAVQPRWMSHSPSPDERFRPDAARAGRMR